MKSHRTQETSQACAFGYEIVPGFIAGTVAAVVAPLLTKEPAPEVTAIYDAAVSEAAEQ